MTQEQENICKDILRRFIYQVRVSNICQLVFHYYNDFDTNNKLKTYPVNTPEYFSSFNTERTKQQIRKKILSSRNDYWNFEESKLKLVENFCINHPKEFNLLDSYIDFLWKCDLSEQEKEFKKEERELKEKDDAQLRAILGDKYDILGEVICLILDDTLEYPYKSDKIKILIELELDIDTIFLILSTKEKWSSPKGYINKYIEERKEKIKQKKVVIYELDSTIKYITNQLKKRKI